MNNEAQNNSQDARIQGLLGNFLRSRALDKDLTHTSERHLDDDSLNAFVEGTLSEREAKPMLTHLVDCSFCRHMTAELVRLDLAFAENDRTAIVEQREPRKVSEVLSGILSRIFGGGEEAVFAHQESEDKDENSGDEEKTEKSEG